MSKKIRLLFLAFGGILFSGLIVFLTYRYLHPEVALEKPSLNADVCDPTSPDCTQKKTATLQYPGQTQTEATSPEPTSEKKLTPAIEAKKIDEKILTEEDEKKSTANLQKFTSDQDEEEETEDEVNIETEASDE